MPLQPELDPSPAKPQIRPDRRPILSYLVLSRVPILIFAAIVAFLPLAESRDVGAYLIGMYDLTWKGALLVGAASFLLWMAINVSINTLIRTAELRFEIQPLHHWLRHLVFPFGNPRIRERFGIWRANLISGIVTMLGIALFLWGLKRHSRDGWLSFVAAVVGFGLVFALGYLVALLTTHGSGGHAWYVYLVRWWTPAGFVNDDKSSVPGHQFAANAFLVSFVLYALAGFLFRPGHASFGPDLAAVVSLLLVLTNLCWMLSGISYLLDRWRIPVFTTILLVALFMPGRDHVFPVVTCKSCAEPPTAEEILETTSGPGRPRILVATSGGGILAATWTAKVLGELTESRPEFRKGLRLISSVSGGSVGAMYYVHLARQGKLTKQELFNRASASSLDAVSFGLAYFDSWRLLGLNPSEEADRAQELRHAWTRNDPALAGAMLSQWPAGNGVPAMMINSTIAETGERFAFTNFRPDNKPAGPAPRKTFREVYKQQDIEVSAAIASSAAFPYVSPAARASAGPKIHLVDGGYYDNFGVASALDFLDSGYQDKRCLREQPVLVILIEAGPADDYTKLDEQAKSESWGYQLLAPPKGLLHMWQIAARQRNYEGLKWLQNLNVSYVPFVYRGNDSPTSWHLTNKNVDEINGQWTTALNQDSAKKVMDYLSSPAFK
jgi:predicted acylesterase/phospholipase RssA